MGPEYKRMKEALPQPLPKCGKQIWVLITSWEPNLGREKRG